MPREKVFISYSHRDREYHDKFVEMLKPVVDAAMLDVWSDERIATGQAWRPEIERALEEAQAALLLVSPHFLASDFITREELPALLDKAQRRGLSLYWLLVSSCLWDKTPLKDIQGALTPGEPLDAMTPASQAKAIRQVCSDLCSKLGQVSRLGQPQRDRLRTDAQRTIADFELGEVVASGQSGILFRGESRQGGAPVAVKVLVDSPLHERPDDDVFKQAETARQLSHPVFIKIRDVQLRERPHCVITEYIEANAGTPAACPAPTLAKVLETERAPFTTDRVVFILRRLCEALSEAHGRDLIYGLLCPSDILMQDARTPRLSGFGFWSYLSRYEDLAGNFVLNREKMSYITPEHFYGLPITAQTDQYTLGIIALELLEGGRRVTIRRPADFELKKAFFAQPFADRAALLDRHAGLVKVLDRMLKEKAEARWESLDEVAMRLSLLESDAVVTAKKSYGACCYDRPAFWQAFYGRLFSACPEVQALFGPPEKMSVQYKLLDHAVQSLLNFPSTPPVEPTVLSATAARHRPMGLELRHFDLFAEALLETLRQEGQQPPAVVEAWRSTIAAGLDYMKRNSVAGRITDSRPIVTTVPGTRPASP